MMWGYYDGWSWFWMVPMMLLFSAGVIAMLLWVVRANSRGTDDTAIQMLRRRLAAGEISQDDFEKTRRILQG